MSEEQKPLEFWVAWTKEYNPEKPLGRIYNILRMVCNYQFDDSVKVIEKSAYDALQKKLEEAEADLSIKLQRTVSAAHHALLEMSAWLGIPEKKRAAYIEEMMSNVRYCAEHNLRKHDESQAINELAQSKAREAMLIRRIECRICSDDYSDILDEWKEMGGKDE